MLNGHRFRHFRPFSLNCDTAPIPIVIDYSVCRLDIIEHNKFVKESLDMVVSY